MNEKLQQVREQMDEYNSTPRKRYPEHSDDIAVDKFAAWMKSKLAKKREQGRGGWETASPEYLSQLLREHVEKGDPVDVANFCMMLHHLGSAITPAPEGGD